MKLSVLRVAGLLVLSVVAALMPPLAGFVLGVFCGYVSETVAPTSKPEPIVVEKVVELRLPAAPASASANESR